MCDFPTILRNSEAVQSLRIFQFPFRYLDNPITRSIGPALAGSTASPNTSLLPNQAGWLFLPFSANQICRRKYLPLLHISKKSSNFAPKFVYARK